MRSIVQPTGGAIWARRRFSSTVSPAMMRRSSGTKATPCAGRLEGAHAVQRLVVEPDLAVLELGGVDPGDGAERRGLAGAVAAEERGISPSCTAKDTPCTM